MRKKIPFIIIAVETFVIFIFIIIALFIFNVNYDKTEVYRQSSGDGSRTVAIYRVGEPGWPFGYVRYYVSGVNGASDFYVEVADDGGYGRFDVRWTTDSVIITFSGEEQEDAVYELPFN